MQSVVEQLPQHILIDDHDNSIFQFINSLVFDLTGGEKKVMMADLIDDLRFLRSTYGLTIEMEKRTRKDLNAIAEVTRLTLEEAYEAVEIIRQEIIKYPPSYIHDLEIERFRLTKTIIKRKTRPNGEEYTMEIGGMASRDEKYVYVTYQSGEHLRLTVHHELCHRADHKDEHVALKNKLVNFFAGSSESFRKEWTALNKHKYSWERYYELAQGKHNSIVEGFARYYGSQNDYEDRATLAELLLCDTNNLVIRAKQDPVLEKKTILLIKKFAQRTNNQMNTRFFQDLIHGKVDEQYWTKRNTNQP